MDYVHRIASDRGSAFLVLAPDGTYSTVASPAGRSRPAVGDWIALDGTGRIEAIAPRRGVLARARADRGNAAQIVATNLDTVLIVTSPGREFSPPRVERYLCAAHAGGIAPVIVLNKADLAADLHVLRMELALVAGGAPVLAISATSGEGCDGFAPYVVPGRTLALVGSSGVGKSTLANRLIGTDRLNTGATRARDGRGKHTSTSRELIALADGAWLIDTPGMRAFAPWADAQALDEAFGDIDAAAERCRFRDCAHTGEPGCAVAAEVGAARLERFHALQAQVAYLERRDDPGLAAAEKRIWRQRSKAQRAQRSW